MSDDSTSAPRNVVLDLVFLSDASSFIARAALALAFCICCAIALGLIALESHYTKTYNPTGVAHLIAAGSSAATAWPGWVAAVFFLIALRRLRWMLRETPISR